MEKLNAITLLEKYQSQHSEEIFYKQKMLKILNHCHDCFSRECLVGHFTASAFLLNSNTSQVLLMHHTKLDKWMQLGGHCDGDKNLLNVAIKEASEESGISNIKPVKSEIFDLDVHLIPANKKDHAHYHFDVRFLLQTDGNDNFIKNQESKELRWFDKNNLAAIPTDSRSILRMFEKL